MQLPIPQKSDINVNFWERADDMSDYSIKVLTAGFADVDNLF